ncbi:MAG: hypothetical protein H0U04_04595, partial [Rubrobacter sp.]|nr:hypothetical protein [Rubrobacter sp.]
LTHGRGHGNGLERREPSLSAALGFGLLLALVGLGGLSFGIYALLRGGRGSRGRIGPLSERGVHVIAGVRMLLIGALSLAAGVYLLWRYFG